ncbi:MAG: hypothetical protein FGF52_03420 [Candidatus Brockarchaeota archaeon]|nr:hypothetical protein [Candidatus Brockarchaeota archaeon]
MILTVYPAEYALTIVESSWGRKVLRGMLRSIKTNMGLQSVSPTILKIYSLGSWCD